MELRLLVIMFLRGSTYGSFGPFATVLVIQAGLPTALVGPLAAAGAVATLLFAPTWGRLGDRHGRRRVLVLAFLAGAPAAAGHATGSLPLLIAAYLAWAVVASAFVPLVDSLSLTRLGGSRSRFARVRIGASSGYIVASLVAGFLVSFTAIGWVWPGLLGAVLCLAAAGAVAARLRGELRSGTGLAAAGGPGLLEGVRAGVGRQRWFLAGLALVFAGSSAPSIFTGPRLAEIGGSGWDIGLATASGTIVELPAFLLLPWMLKWVGGRRVFLIGGVLLGVSGVLAAVAPTPVLLILARLLFGAGYAWVVIPSLGAILSMASPTEQAASAALHFASQAAGSLVVALAGLPLVGLTGSVFGVLVAAALAAPVGALVALRAWPKTPAPTPAAPG
ncbi:MAG: MFS transporter [Candidatus Limnocylindrales bacterium]